MGGLFHGSMSDKKSVMCYEDYEVMAFGGYH
jgi:hypothetical protein